MKYTKNELNPFYLPPFMWIHFNYFGFEMFRPKGCQKQYLLSLIKTYAFRKNVQESNNSFVQQNWCQNEYGFCCHRQSSTTIIISNISLLIPSATKSNQFNDICHWNTHFGIDNQKYNENVLDWIEVEIGCLDLMTLIVVCFVCEYVKVMNHKINNIRIQTHTIKTCQRELSQFSFEGVWKFALHPTTHLEMMVIVQCNVHLRLMSLAFVSFHRTMYVLCWEVVLLPLSKTGWTFVVANTWFMMCCCVHSACVKLNGNLEIRLEIWFDNDNASPFSRGVCNTWQIQINVVDWKKKLPTSNLFIWSNGWSLILHSFRTFFN